MNGLAGGGLQALQVVTYRLVAVKERLWLQAILAYRLCAGSGKGEAVVAVKEGQWFQDRLVKKWQ